MNQDQASTYIPLLAKRGVLVQLGLVLEPHQVRVNRSDRNLFSRKINCE